MTPRTTPPAADRPGEDGGREALAAVLHPPLIGGTGNAAASCGGACRELADRMLASGWLRDHDVAVRTRAGEDIVAAIKNEATPGGRAFLDQYDDGYNGGLETAVRVVWEVAAHPTLGADLMEQGRRLASERDDLIAQGADPAELEVPLAPDTPGGTP